MPYRCSHFYFDINFGDRRGYALFFSFDYNLLLKFDIKVKVSTWIAHKIKKKQLSFNHCDKNALSNMI